ncbi:hypothetical protein DXG01_012429, partial [Tephrocybe rancida]
FTSTTILCPAHGNVFNHADVDDFIESDVIPTKGEVHLYTSHGDPQQTDPSKVKATMFVKHEMSSLTLGPVLNKLGSRFSPIKKSNSCIFTWEEDMWNIKGRFEDAIQDDDDVSWVKENNKYIIRILAQTDTGQMAVPPPVSSKITASSATKASTSGAKSKKDELIELLKIDRDILESTDRGLRAAYQKYCAFLHAETTLREKLDDNSW